MAEFRHMLPGERKIWVRFLSDPPWPVTNARYDVHLGEGVPVDPAWPEWLQYAAKTLTQKRVDAIVASGPDVWIIEIKNRAGLSALGQLLGYAILYMMEYKPVNAPKLAVVCESTAPDVGTVLANYGISVFVV